jgi:hypothetical protein
MHGIFSAHVFKGTNPDRLDVQYGPLIVPKRPDPVQHVVASTLGKIPVEPNGLMEIDPSGLEYLKS